MNIVAANYNLHEIGKKKMAHTRRVAIVPAGFYKQLNQLSTADFLLSPKRRKAINCDEEGVYAAERIICSRASKMDKVSLYEQLHVGYNTKHCYMYTTGENLTGWVL